MKGSIFVLVVCLSLVSCGPVSFGEYNKMGYVDVEHVERNLVLVDSLVLKEYNSTKYAPLEFRGYFFEQGKEDSICLSLWYQANLQSKILAFDSVSFLENGFPSELYGSIKFLLEHDITDCYYDSTDPMYKKSRIFIHEHGYEYAYCRRRFVVFKEDGEYLVSHEYYRMYDTLGNLMLMGYKK